MLSQVSKDWRDKLHQCWSSQIQSFVTLNPSCYDSLGRSDAKLMLSPSYCQCLDGWSRATVFVFEKNNNLVTRFIVRCTRPGVLFRVYVGPDLHSQVRNWFLVVNTLLRSHQGCSWGWGSNPGQDTSQPTKVFTFWGT